MNVNIPITKEEYEEAMKLTEKEQELKYTTVSERCGYGVYGFKIVQDKDGYFVRYTRGDSCD